MKLQFNCLSMDGSQVREQIKQHYLSYLEQAEDELIEEMKTKVWKNTYKDAPGKPEWRQDVEENLREVYRKITNSIIELKVGLPIDEMQQHEIVRAMIVEEGSGFEVGNEAIRSKPGEQVWSSDLDAGDPQISRANSEYLLPDRFNQEGNHFIQDSIKTYRKHFKDILREASITLPPSVFFGNVYEKPQR